MGHIDTHIQVCLLVTLVLNVFVKSKMDQTANFNNHQIFPLQPKFCIWFFITTPFKRFPFFLDAATGPYLSGEEASYGRRAILGKEAICRIYCLKEGLILRIA